MTAIGLPVVDLPLDRPKPYPDFRSHYKAAKLADFLLIKMRIF
jgi:hypothetical protein